MSIGVQHATRPHIRFESRPEEDRAASIEAGHKVYHDVNWVIITPVGGRDVVENKADQWLANIRDRAQVGQYDADWVEHFSKMYKLYKEGQELPEDGTPLRMCATLFSPAEIQNCIEAGIRTLEQLAAANEEAMGRMHMMGRALKLRAQEAIRLGEAGGDAMKLEALTIENEELKRKVSDQDGKIAALTEIVNEMRSTAAINDAGGRGRKQQQTA
ncbi:hypothetical protein [Burkholderia glumae]|uniref:hypothetical protein n=1 Tax=Burkholderia glumae TaxID=337 RepID=UPI0021509309|nr:hypothetical protein [Burkholderia glumae]